MNKLDEASLIALIDDNEEILKMFYRLLASPPEFSYTISPMIIPYIASVSDGNSLLIGGAEDYHDINGKGYKKIISETRLRTKIYSSEKLANSLKNIERISNVIYHDLTCNYNQIQKKCISIMGQKTLGINTYNDIPIFNNFLGYSYLSEFFEIEDSKFISDVMLNSSYIVKFSEYSANYISNVIIDYKRKISREKITGIELNTCELGMQDYLIKPETKQEIFRVDTVEMSICIFLLNILCTLNFIKLILSKIIDKESPLYYRIKFMTYISSIESIDRLTKGFNRKSGAQQFTKEIEDLLNKKRRLISESIRNHIFHYKILEKDILANKLEVDRVFFSLIEGVTEMSFLEFDSIIDSEYDKLINLINKWIFNQKERG